MKFDWHPRVRTITLALLTAAVVSPSLPADWVELKDGRRLRGVDFKKKGDGHLFTLENGKRVFFAAALVASFEKSAPGEKVEHEGKQVSLRAKIKALRAAAAKRERRALKDLERWARGRSGADAAKERVQALPPKDRERLLATALVKSSKKSARRLAAQELGNLAKGTSREKPVVNWLASAAIRDRYKSVRDQSLLALQSIGHKDTALSFTGALRDRSPRHRIHAANALSLFPDRRAMPELIKTMRYTWAGFGRGFVFQGVQRSYISDYELVSGGTGFSVVEVADPVIQTNTTGVSLDADVRKVEMISRVRAMRKISGQNFGFDSDKWSAWWEEESAAAAEDNGAAKDRGAKQAP